MIKPRIKKFVYLFLMCFTLGITWGYSSPQQNQPPEPQNTPFDGPGSQPGLPLPIDDYLPIFFIAALGFGILFLKRKKAAAI